MFCSFRKWIVGSLSTDGRVYTSQVGRISMNTPAVDKTSEIGCCFFLIYRISSHIQSYPGTLQNNNNNNNNKKKNKKKKKKRK